VPNSNRGRETRRIWVSGFDAETWNNLCAYCLREFGAIRGHIGEVMSRAVDNYLRDSYKRSIISSQQRLDVETTFRKLVEELICAEALEVTDRDIYNILDKLGKKDPRTKRRYIDLLEDRGEIKYKQTSPSGLRIYVVSRIEARALGRQPGPMPGEPGYI